MFSVGVEFCDVLVNFESACIEGKNKDVNYIFQKTLSLNARLYVRENFMFDFMSEKIRFSFL